jgi:hypothetical protein
MKKIVLLYLFALTCFALHAHNGGGHNPPHEASRPSPSLVAHAQWGNVHLYPNPADDYFQIANGEEVRRVVVHNIVGRQVKAFNNVQDGDRLSVSDLPTGLYLVRMWDKDDRTVATVRLSKR